MAENFVSVAKLEDIQPGKMRRIEVDGHRILLANVDGTIYATDDMCTHEDASLSTGSLKGDLVKCPLHGSRFNVRTGEALEDPAEENLKTYPIRVEDGDILVGV